MRGESLSLSVDINLFCREINQAFLVQTAEQFSTSHIFQGAVGLVPIPDSTQLSGDKSPPPSLVLIDERANKVNILGGNLTSPNDEVLLHAKVYNRNFRKTPAKNEGLLISRLGATITGFAFP